MEIVTSPTLESTTEHPGPNPQHPERVTVDKLKLLHDFVLVVPLATPLKKTGGTMFIPETAGSRERNSRGIVVSVGPGDFNTAGTTILPMSVDVGDLVYFGKYAGTEEEFDGETVLAMRETECRLRVRAGSFKLVTHDDPKLNHLVEDWCDVCYGDPEAEAKARLEAAREEAAATRRALDGISSLQVDELAPAPTFGEVALLEARTPRRPCVEPGCLFIQQLIPLQPGPGPSVWVGRSCGHEHPAGLVAP